MAPTRRDTQPFTRDEIARLVAEHDEPPPSVRDSVLEAQSFRECPTCGGTGWVPPDDGSLAPTTLDVSEDTVTSPVAVRKGGS